MDDDGRPALDESGQPVLVEIEPEPASFDDQ
jgi:hypothetical protein